MDRPSQAEFSSTRAPQAEFSSTRAPQKRLRRRDSSANKKTRHQQHEVQLSPRAVSPLVVRQELVRQGPMHPAPQSPAPQSATLPSPTPSLPARHQEVDTLLRETVRAIMMEAPVTSPANITQSRADKGLEVPGPLVQASFEYLYQYMHRRTCDLQRKATELTALLQQLNPEIGSMLTTGLVGVPATLRAEYNASIASTRKRKDKEASAHLEALLSICNTSHGFGQLIIRVARSSDPLLRGGSKAMQYLCVMECSNAA
jgi:hypothetical protein